MTGGRDDLTYSVVCAHCSEGQCVPCGEKIRFEPSAADLQETTVVVTDLDAHLNYTFTVEAHSGVSQFNTEKAVASLTTALDYTGEITSSDVLTRMLSQTAKTGAYTEEFSLTHLVPRDWIASPWAVISH